MNVNTSPGKNRLISRRDFLKLAGLGAGTLSLIGLGFLRRRQSEGQMQEGDSYALTTVAELMQSNPDIESQVLIPNAQAVFGEAGRFSPEDQVIVVAAPPRGKAMVIEMAGFTGGAATKKKGTPTTFGIQIQRLSETADAAVMYDAMNPYPSLVVRETNSASKFRPLFPAAEKSALQMDTRGFGLVQSPAGEQPLLICIEASDDAIVLVSPTKSFWENNGVTLDMESQAQVSTTPVSFPAFDP